MGKPMNLFFRRLWTNQDGAEIVEWVIVAAVLIGVAAGGYQLLGSRVENAANAVGDQLVEQVGGGSGGAGEPGAGSGEIVTGTGRR